MENRHSSIPRPGIASIVLCLILITLGLTAAPLAQDRPFTVHPAQPAILNGPYLVAPMETGVTIVWRTDTPCHSGVRFGTDRELLELAEPDEHGLAPVGTLHRIRLDGLIPGETYYYQVVSTRVVRLKAYWPEKGLSVESPVFQFTLPSRDKPEVTFSFITDTQHEDLGRLKRHLDAVDWKGSEFVVHGGDAVDWVRDEDQVFDSWLEPVTSRLDHTTGLVFMRGNHDMRGPFARMIYDYVDNGTGSFYYSFDAGPLHFVVLDSGEDKDDATPVYAELNRMRAYREREYDWFATHVKESARFREAPFRVLLIHNPGWGWVNDENEKWADLAANSGIDLILSGHRHRLIRQDPPAETPGYTSLTVGQDQVARIRATSERIEITVVDTEGKALEQFSLLVRQ